MEYKQFYRRKLPHIHSPGATLFVTFRLAGSIPKSVIENWKHEKLWLEKERERVASDRVTQSQTESLLAFHRRWFAKFEEVLHKEETGPLWLKEEDIANSVSESLKYRDGKVYKLHCFCIMPNHVHVVFTPFLKEQSLTEIKFSNPRRFESSEPTLGATMQSLKGYTAHEANKLLNRAGQFWETESYDHEIRDAEEFDRIIKYVLDNPVKAGLIQNRQDWKWNFLQGCRTGC